MFSRIGKTSEHWKYDRGQWSLLPKEDAFYGDESSDRNISEDLLAIHEPLSDTSFAYSVMVIYGSSAFKDIVHVESEAAAQAWNQYIYVTTFPSLLMLVKELEPLHNIASPNIASPSEINYGDDDVEGEDGAH